MKFLCRIFGHKWKTTIIVPWKMHDVNGERRCVRCEKKQRYHSDYGWGGYKGTR